MMTLPQFDNPNITTEELLAEQVRLHAQADTMMQETGILDIFAKYGEVSPIGGSYDCYKNTIDGPVSGWYQSYQLPHSY
jgi:hypothetical protein